MPERTHSVEGISGEKLDRIRERALEEERKQLSYKQPHKIRPILKEIVEEEIIMDDMTEVLEE